jgi:ribosomal protein S12 methylthiotransferase accessory factor
MRVDELGRHFKVFDLSPPGWPVSVSAALALPEIRTAIPTFPEAALAEYGRHASGRGADAASSRRGAVAEAVEIASLCEWGDERLIQGTAEDVPLSYLPLSACLGFSETQLANRDTENRRLSGLDFVPALPAQDIPLSWVFALDPVRRMHVLVPADAVLIGRERPDVVAFADTNGCAAGPTATAARLAALLELIERDATGRWWYGARRRKMLDPASLPDPASRHVDWARATGRILRLFDITTDLAIPVVGAMLAQSDGRGVTLGFAARGRLVEAAQDAIAEAMQMHLLADAGNARTPGTRSWFAEVTTSTPPLDPGGKLHPVSDVQVRPGEEDLFATCLLACSRFDIEVLFLDRTRKEFGVPVWQALAPALCHWKPRLGRPRLLAEDPNDLTAPVLNPVLLRV